MLHVEKEHIDCTATPLTQCTSPFNFQLEKKGKKIFEKTFFVYLNLPLSQISCSDLPEADKIRRKALQPSVRHSQMWNMLIITYNP